MNICPIRGCGKSKGAAWHLVCRDCWAKVPSPLQQKLFAAYKRERGGDEHRLAVREVLQHLREEATDATP